MSITPLRLVVIVGSTREGRFAPTVANWFVEQAGLHGELDVDVVDLAESRLPGFVADGADTAAETAAVGARLAAADAFVVVTPEYNHSFPAPLKAAIDLYRKEWQAKPVGFVSYGGMSGGLRAVEQLRLVFAELHATTVRDTVSFHQVWERFGADGRPVDETATNAAAKGMLDQVVWWGDALRTARTAHPYGA